ncbi:MAG: PAS domain-containing protein [Bacteroidetes bacterium]|nr:PAS domain-containing protein [Bacteroidota bacterium]
MDKKLRKEYEKEFLEYHLPDSIPIMRIGLILTLLLFFLYFILHTALFPDSEMKNFMMRFGIIFPFILASVVAISIYKLRKHLNLVLTIINLLSAAGVFIVGVFSNSYEPGYDYYYTWVGLVIIGIFCFFRLRLRNLLLIGLTLFLAYLFAVIFNHSYQKNPETFLTQVLFVFSMTTVGFFISYIIDKKIRKDFSQEKRLRENFSILRNEMKEKESAVAAFISSQKNYHNALESIPDMVNIVDPQFNIVLVNAALRKWNKSAGIISENLVGMRISDLFPFLFESFYKEVEQVFSSGISLLTEKKYLINGEEIIIEARKVPLFQDHKVVQVMVIFRDVTKQKELEELRQRNAEQKELMLKEIHHRVKNNLAIVISLISIQIRNNPHPELNRIMKDIELRIRSMAMIHEQLYRSENFDCLPLSDYLQSLSSVIVNALTQGNIDLQVDMVPCQISIQSALPIGLITNELVTNAIKYAFPGKCDGIVKVSLKHDETTEGYLVLTIEDNGIGLPDNFSFDDHSSMGMFIVKLLSEQLEAKLEIIDQPGTCFQITFRNGLFNKTIS